MSPQPGSVVWSLPIHLGAPFQLQREPLSDDNSPTDAAGALAGGRFVTFPDGARRNQWHLQMSIGEIECPEGETSFLTGEAYNGTAKGT
jgi:hypothetical protein